MRVFNLSLSSESAVFSDKLSRIEKLVLEVEPMRRQFANAKAENALHDIVSAYFSPFILSEDAQNCCKDSIDRILTRADF